MKTFLPLFLMFLTACAEISKIQPVVQPSPTLKRELKKDISNDSWVKIYFGEMEQKKRPGIDKVAKDNGFSVLREKLLPENDLEVRVWVGFGLYGNDGLLLRRSSGTWSAVNLRQLLCHLDERGKYNLEAPKSGWEATWSKLVDAEILTLPDSSKLKYEGGPLDGKSYVIETNSNDMYRTYHYGNPKYSQLNESKHMIKIGKIIADEFDLKSFDSKTADCGEDD